MARLTVSIAARADIRQVINYLETRAGKITALRYALAFDETIDRIADVPGIGSPRPELGGDLRLCIVHPYLVFYDYNATDDTVQVLRVLHGHRKVTAEMVRQT